MDEQNKIILPGEITKLLHAPDRPEAFEQVMELLYQDLRDMARRYLQGDPDHTLQPTALVHEAYMELVGKKDKCFQDRHHFFAHAALVMRHLVFKYARDMNRLKRGGGQCRIPLEDVELGAAMDPDYLLALERALDKLKKLDQSKHQLVELRTFLGLSIKEIASVMAVSLRKVERDWQFCRLWLAREISR